VKRESSILPPNVGPAFAAFSVVGVALGLLGGADLLPEVLFGIGLFLIPAVFIVWAIAHLDLERLKGLTGSTSRMQQRSKGMHLEISGSLILAAERGSTSYQAGRAIGEILLAMLALAVLATIVRWIRGQ